MCSFLCYFKGKIAYVLYKSLFNIAAFIFYFSLQIKSDKHTKNSVKDHIYGKRVTGSLVLYKSLFNIAAFIFYFSLQIKSDKHTKNSVKDHIYGKLNIYMSFYMCTSHH